MFISFKKYGILVPVLLIAGILGAHHVLESFHIDRGRWQSLTMFFPALLLMGVGGFLEYKGQANSFCHLPMIAWGVLVSILGVVVLWTG